MSTTDFPSCPECFLVVSDMMKHRYIEHGIEIDAEEARKLAVRAKQDAERTKENAKIDMVYMGDKGPIQPK
jgi:hypothetical protein